ncbi:MAG: ABC transporter substrate-binding protein [Oscillibacter sp.]|nr:ABC transporter substrate-binding protein [Oscillibacter sp.]
MKKKIFALSLALILALALAACGGSGSAGDTQKTDAPAGTQAPPADTQTPPAETVTLKVAASPTPHAEILNQCVDILKAQGIDLVVTEYSDYVFPNTAVEDGEEDANYFQHIPYLNNFNAERGTHLVSIAGIHIEPIGIYAGKTASLDAIPDGGRIAVPNDTTNEGRALLLLEAQGIIKLKDSTKLDSTPNDIAENPKNLEFVELAAENIPSNLDEVDVAAINSNYALGAGLNPVEDALVLENSEDNPYVNILAVKEGNENSEVIQALVKALQSDTVRDYILNTYGGAVLPAF